MQPRLGIFLSRDAWEGEELRPGSMNGWNYAEGNPINRADPAGHAICLWPNHWEEYTDPDTGERRLRCVGPSSGGGVGGIGGVGQVANPPIGRTGTGIGFGTGTQVLIGIGVLLCAAIIEDLQQPHPNVIVELGAGDYSNAIAMKEQFPWANVIATNLFQEWDFGRRLYKPGKKPELGTEHVVGVYKGWLDAKKAGVIVGDPKPYENQDIPAGIADLVYTIMPYPETALEFGLHAARIVSKTPGTIVAITAGRNSSSFWDFDLGFRGGGARASQVLIGEGAPFGLKVPTYKWESGPNFTALYVQTSLFP